MRQLFHVRLFRLLRVFFLRGFYRSCLRPAAISRRAFGGLALVSAAVPIVRKNDEEQPEDSLVESLAKPTDTSEPAAWQMVSEYENVSVYRRPVAGSGQFEYKVHGRMDDISPLDFFHCLIDLDYRRYWDPSSTSIESVGFDDAGNELIRWYYRLPKPLCVREYLYSRRHSVDLDKGLFYVESRAVDPAELGRFNLNDQRRQELFYEGTSCVRVNEYHSSVTVVSRGAHNEPGLEYVMTYFNEPKAKLPAQFYKMLCTKGLLNYLSQLHSAAVELPSLLEKFPRPPCLASPKPSATPPSDNQPTEEKENSWLAWWQEPHSGRLHPFMKPWWQQRFPDMFEDFLECSQWFL